MKNHFWQFKNLANGSTELLLYGEIQSSQSWWDDSGSVYADQFVQELQALGNIAQITVRINSVGGDIFAAMAIYTELKTNSARIVCVVDGLAASAATLVLMAADEIQVPSGAIIMIHNPLSVLMGSYNADDLAKITETLGTIKDSIIAIYSKRTGLDADTLSDMMSGEEWMTADEAIENGFADTIIDEEISTQVDMKGKIIIMNKVTHDLSGFNSMPELQHAENIKNAIINQGGLVSKFVALAGKFKNKPKAKSKTEQDNDDNSDDTGDEPDEEDDTDGKKPKNAVQISFIDETAGQIDSTVHAKNIAAFKNLYPNFFDNIMNDARAEERQRIQDIDNLAGHVDAQMLYDAKYKNITTAMELSYESMKNSTEKGAAYLSARAQASQTSNAHTVTAAPVPMQETTNEQQMAAYGEMIAGFANKKINKGRRINQNG